MIYFDNIFNSNDIYLENTIYYNIDNIIITKIINSISFIIFIELSCFYQI